MFHAGPFSLFHQPTVKASTSPNIFWMQPSQTYLVKC